MTALTGLARPSAIAVFGNKPFTLLWSAQAVSTIGSALTSLAASILIYRLVGSAFSVGLMLIATAVPGIFVGLIAGVFVDRWDRKHILVAADLMRAVFVALIPILIPFGITWLYVMVVLSSIVTQFYQPAHESVLPELASDAELAAANSMMAISSFGFTTVGFAAAGLMAALFPIAWAFYLDALTFIVSAACVSLIRIAPLPSEDDTSVAVVWRNLRAGAQFLFTTASLRSLLLLALPVGVVFGLQYSWLLPFALKALHATEFDYGLQEGVTAVGFVLGSLLMVRLADRLHPGQWVALSYGGQALAGMVYALQRSVPLAIAMVMISSFANAPAVIGRKLVIQQTTPRDVRGRVNSAFSVTMNVMFVLGMAAAGLADLYNVRGLFFGSSLILLGVASVALLLPGVRQPIEEWRQAIAMLRAAPAAPGLGLGRAATLGDWDRLTRHQPALTGLDAQRRKSLAAQTRVYDVLAGTAVVRHGEQSDAAYFVLNGRVVAGRDGEGAFTSLETLTAGDVFGEIAALTGVPRTANVVAEQPTTILQVPAPTLRQMMNEPQLHQFFLSKMAERMVRMGMVDLPRFAGVDQQSLRELRTPEAQPAI